MHSVTFEQWQRMQRLLDQTLELGPEASSAFLERACEGDEPLRHEVERLLDACRRAGGASFLEQPPAALAASLLAGESTRQRIDRYRIVGEAGRGGMGVVYEAERDDGQFAQRVALKVLPRGLESEHAVRRLLGERQILASLSHPAIARLLDGGVTGDGLPWFAMEYVDGTPIDGYCDAQRLSVPARLELFCQMCDAVQYAHRNLVVHRDLKPSNILITGDGAVKLLDFGIAKLLAASSGDAGDDETQNTETGWRALTPGYASPEQVRGEPVSTATDVYSLGVLLYRLLTGQHPYRFGGRTPGEIERTIVEVQPDRPSAVVQRAADAALELPAPLDVARARATSPAALARTLRGDLDVIVLMAMRKEPERRYDTVGQLAADVRRHLARLPVSARADTWRYRSRKFAQRHRLGVAAAMLLATSLVAGGVATGIQARIARHERDNARRQAATAAQVSSLLVDLFRLSDPTAARGATITARDVLAQGVRRVEAELDSLPEIQAAMLGELGTVHRNLGLLDDAERLTGQAAAIWDSLGRVPELATSLDRLGELSWTRAQFDSAESRFRRALALRRSLQPVPAAGVATILAHLGNALAGQRRQPEAEQLFREALAIQRQVYGDRSAEVAATLFALAATLHGRGDFAGAEPLFHQALDIYRAVPGAPDTLAATALINLGNVALFRERYTEAEPLLREALGIRRRVFGNDHPVLIEPLTGLGTLLHAESRFAEAEPVLNEARSLALRHLGPRHPDLFQIEQILGATLLELGRIPEAVPMQRRALEGLRNQLGAAHPLAIYARVLLAESEMTLGMLHAAQIDFEGALASARAIDSQRPHPYVGLAQRGLAQIDLELGRTARAESAVRDALRLLEAALRPEHRYVLGTRRLLATVLLERGGYGEADSLLAGVLAAERQLLPPRHADIARTLHTYGVLRIADGNPRDAEALLREALAIRRERLGPRHWAVGDSESALGAALARLGRCGEADSLLATGYETIRRERRDNSRVSRRARARLADGCSETVARVRD